MIKNRTAQLIFQTIYCTLGLVGVFASLGIFDDINTIRWDFYVHFTNISNFLCIGVMAAFLIQTAKKKEDSYVSTYPMLKMLIHYCSDEYGKIKLNIDGFRRYKLQFVPHAKSMERELFGFFNDVMNNA